jgi:hypothetical protein
MEGMAFWIILSLDETTETFMQNEQNATIP